MYLVDIQYNGEKLRHMYVAVKLKDHENFRWKIEKLFV